MPDTDPAALLALIRADLRTAADGGLSGIKAGDYLPAALTRHTRTLLAAVEAALKLADDWANTPWPDDGGDRAGVATEQAIHDGVELRAAITAALTEGGES